MEHMSDRNDPSSGRTVRDIRAIIDQYLASAAHLRDRHSAELFEDILKGFILYLYDNPTSVTMIDSGEADRALMRASRKNKIGIEKGFYSWKHVSRLIQNLQLLSYELDRFDLMEAFKECLQHTNVFPSYVPFKRDVIDLVDSLSQYDTVFMPEFSMDIAIELAKERTVVAIPSGNNDFIRCIFHIIGIKNYSEYREAFSNKGREDPDRGMFHEIVLIVRPDCGKNFYEVVKGYMDLLHSNGNLIMVTHPKFVYSAGGDEMKIKEYLSGFQIDCHYRIPASGFRIPLDIYVSLIKKQPTRYPTQIVSVSQDSPLEIGNSNIYSVSQVDSLAMSEGRNPPSGKRKCKGVAEIYVESYDFDFIKAMNSSEQSDLPTVKLSQLAEFTPGMPVSKDCLTKENDGSLLRYIRFRDIMDGGISDHDPVYVNKDDPRIARAGSIVISTRGGFGMSFILENDVVLSQFFTEVAIRDDGLPGHFTDLDPAFLLYFFRSRDFIRQANLFSSGNSVNVLTMKRLNDIDVPDATDAQRKRIVSRISNMKDPSPERIWDVFLDVLSE